MKHSFLRFIATIIVFASCHKPDALPDTTPSTQTPVVLKGGKGGNYSIVAFTKQNTADVNARVFIKYAANTAPVDTNGYDEKYTAVAEPEYGTHAHFNKLTTGTYFIRAMYNTIKADTVLEIKDSTVAEIDFTLQLK